MNIIRKQLITVLALAAAASLTACSSVSNAPSEVAVKVNDGVLFPVEKTILDCVQPSKKKCADADAASSQ
jgi:putative hemolysin